MRFLLKSSTALSLAAVALASIACFAGNGPSSPCLDRSLRSGLSAKTSKELSAEAAGLHYAFPEGPGITRTVKKSGQQFSDPKGRRVTDAKALKRLNSLGIPPAYREVWISPDPLAHIQAVATDARGRQQYYYHPQWIAARADAKYERMERFGKSLRKINDQIEADIRRNGIPRERVLAALTRIMEQTGIRVGSREYAEENGTYGLTTLLKKQVQVSGDRVQLKFIGKAGVRHKIEVEDPDVADVTRQSLALQGKRGFQFRDADQHVHEVDAGMVNAYIKAATGESFSAKDFRTWEGTAEAARALIESGPALGQKDADAKISAAVLSASKLLGNTPSVCRSSYIYPELLKTYSDPDAFRKLLSRLKKPPTAKERGLKPEERLVLMLF